MQKARRAAGLPVSQEIKSKSCSEHENAWLCKAVRKRKRKRERARPADPRYFAFLPNRSDTSVIEMNASASMSWTIVRILAIWKRLTTK